MVNSNCFTSKRGNFTYIPTFESPICGDFQDKLSVSYNNCCKIQGHPTQTVLFEIALKVRNMQVKFDLMSVLEC